MKVTFLYLRPPISVSEALCFRVVRPCVRACVRACVLLAYDIIRTNGWNFINFG